MDDQQLLQGYVRHRSEEAFTRLIDRHVNLVYSAALRQLKDPHTAEDVTQTAFLALARHASRLTGERVLSAWLLVTTRNAALDAIKARSRRLRHEREAAQMATTIQQLAGEDSQWDQIAPHVDEALASLSADDRRAVTLRYFEGCTPTQVAQRLGISLDAARQRVHRATSRMRGYFTKRGLDISAVALGPLIANHAVHTAPAALAAATAKALSIGLARTATATTVSKATTIAIAASKAEAALITVAALLVVGSGAAAVQHVIKRHRATRIVAVAEITRTPAAVPQSESSTVIGYARTPDGKPVVGAEVLVSTTHHYVRLMHGSTWKGGVPVPPFLELGHVTVGQTLSYGTGGSPKSIPARMVTGWQGTTDSNGRFELHLNQPAAGVIVRSKLGIGTAPASDLTHFPRITVAPWARVEGDLREGNHPVPKASVTFENLSKPEKLESENLVIEGAALTDDAGHFLIPEATPGATWMTRYAILDGKQVTGKGGSTEFMTWPAGHADPKLVEFQPGTTTHVTLGGVGRPVTGHVSSKLDAYTFRRATISPTPKSGPSRPIGFPCQIDISPDGSFKGEDFPAGHYHLHIDVGTAIERRRSYAYLDYAAAADLDFEIPPMEGNQSDVPFDIAPVTLKPNPHLIVGKPVPDLTATLSDGSAVRLSQLRGEYVLLQIGANAFQPYAREQDRLLPMIDHFSVDPKFALLSIDSDPDSPDPDDKNKPTSFPGPRAHVNNLEKDIPPEYQNSGSPLYIVDPDGNLLANNLDGFSAYNLLDKALRSASSSAHIEVDHLPRASVNANTPYTRVPAPNPDNAARLASIKIVDGKRAENSGPPDRLVDGRMPATEDAPTQNFKFQDDTLEGRIGFDLGHAIPIAAINSYSWHKEKRGPQVYHVYGSDGTNRAFDASPKIGTNPATCGWRLIASVDTRSNNTPPGGRYAVSISNPGATLGTYRYLLFVMFPAQADDVSGHTFYSEINVIEGK